MVDAVTTIASCRPVRSQGHHLLAQSPLGPLPPTHRLPGYFWQGADQFPGRVKRSRALLGRLPSPFVGWRSGLLGSSHLTGQAHPEGALHPAHVGELTLVFWAPEEGGVLTIARVCHHHLERHLPLPREIHQTE